MFNNKCHKFYINAIKLHKVGVFLETGMKLDNSLLNNWFCAMVMQKTRNASSEVLFYLSSSSSAMGPKNCLHFSYQKKI